MEQKMVPEVRVTRKEMRVAEAIAKAMTTKPPRDDYCGFAAGVGNALARLSDQRNSGYSFVAKYLAFGILEWIEENEAELDEKTAAEDDGASERREAVKRLLRLVAIDGKPVTPP